jgi:hypothetical protein
VQSAPLGSLGSCGQVDGERPIRAKARRIPMNYSRLSKHPRPPRIRSAERYPECVRSSLSSHSVPCFQPVHHAETRSPSLPVGPFNPLSFVSPHGQNRSIPLYQGPARLKRGYREYPGDPNLFAPQHFLARVLPINAKGFSFPIRLSANSPQDDILRAELTWRRLAAIGRGSWQYPRKNELRNPELRSSCLDYHRAVQSVRTLESTFRPWGLVVSHRMVPLDHPGLIACSHVSLGLRSRGVSFAD